MFKLIKVAFLGAIALAFAATAYADFTFVLFVSHPMMKGLAPMLI